MTDVCQSTLCATLHFISVVFEPVNLQISSINVRLFKVSLFLPRPWHIFNAQQSDSLDLTQAPKSFQYFSANQVPTEKLKDLDSFFGYFPLDFSCVRVFMVFKETVFLSLKF